jgi:hypothetical protein
MQATKSINLAVILGMLLAAAICVSVACVETDAQIARAEQAHCEKMVQAGVWPAEQCK